MCTCDNFLRTQEFSSFEAVCTVGLKGYSVRILAVESILATKAQFSGSQFAEEREIAECY